LSALKAARPEQEFRLRVQTPAARHPRESALQNTAAALAEANTTAAAAAAARQVRMETGKPEACRYMAPRSVRVVVVVAAPITEALARIPSTEATLEEMAAPVPAALEQVLAEALVAAEVPEPMAEAVAEVVAAAAPLSLAAPAGVARSGALTVPAVAVVPAAVTTAGL
jgi:hypothetical protein